MFTKGEEVKTKMTPKRYQEVYVSRLIVSVGVRGAGRGIGEPQPSEANAFHVAESATDAAYAAAMERVESEEDERDKALDAKLEAFEARLDAVREKNSKTTLSRAKQLDDVSEFAATVAFDAARGESLSEQERYDAAFAAATRAYSIALSNRKTKLPTLEVAKAKRQSKSRKAKQS